MPSAQAALSALGRELAESLWPTRCVGCGMPGELLCERCRAELPWISQRWACPSCGAPFGYLTCTECAHDWELSSVVCALPFEGPGASLATVLKDAHETRLAPVIAAAMAGALDEARGWEDAGAREGSGLDSIDAISFVPATAAAFRRRGFDHMQLVAESLSQLTGIPVADALARAHARDQRALGREQRRENLEGSVRCVEDVSGLSILLADDVITTGASMRACACALAARGASRVMGIALARVW